MLKVTCAIILHQNKILITQRNATSDHPMKWEFPGGKLKLRETIEECIIREIKEELEIEIVVLEKIKQAYFDYGFKQIELIPFLCKIKSGQIRLTEHIDFKWIKLNNLESIDFTEADKKLIQMGENKDILKKYLRKNMNNAR